MDTILNARYFGIIIHGKDNIAKLKYYIRKEYRGDEKVELGDVTLQGKICDNVAFLHDSDEMSGISLGNVAFGHWNSKKQIIEELKSWEKRPYKHLVEIVKDSKIKQESKGRIVLGKNWWNGPDWFVFSEMKNLKTLTTH